MYSSDLKSRAINLYYKFLSFRKVASLLLIGKSTLHRWIHAVNFSNNTSNKTNIQHIINFIEILLKGSSNIDICTF